jgi:hypothetical protein
MKQIRMCHKHAKSFYSKDTNETVRFITLVRVLFLSSAAKKQIQGRTTKKSGKHLLELFINFAVSLFEN